MDPEPTREEGNAHDATAERATKYIAAAVKDGSLRMRAPGKIGMAVNVAFRLAAEKVALYHDDDPEAVRRWHETALHGIAKDILGISGITVRIQVLND